MSVANSGNGTLHALLIGIDCYLPGSLPGGIYYPSLGGCVRDITHVEDFLRSTLEIPRERILKLTATSTGAPQPPEPREAWPTYENMVAAFERLLAAAQPGDQVYVHYSGHGGRTPTLVPEKKGQGGQDESLVPTDIHRNDARYLRDIELALIFKRMVDKGLHLTVVLDSCHSGGAVRGTEKAQDLVAVRGLADPTYVDTTPRPTDSLVASAHELAATWDAATRSGTRNVAAGSSWLPEPEGYVLLAACRPSESAYEFAFNGRERNGALTYWLLDTLRAYGTGLTYTTLHDRIVARVHSQFVQQTPQLQGEGQNLFFGGAQGVPKARVTVLEVRAAEKGVKLAVGQALGVGQDAQFAVYPFGTADFRAKEKRQAVVTLTDVGATDSWGSVTEGPRGGSIEPGSPAILINPGSARLVRSVAVLKPEDLDKEVDREVARPALEAVRRGLVGNPWVGEAAEGDPIELQVAVNEEGNYEIWDGTGKTLANLRPPLKAGAQGASEGVVKRLVHLARYRATEQLENYDPLSPLAGKLAVELAGVQDKYVRGEKPNPRPFAEPGRTPTLETGQTTFLRVRNNSSQKLNVVVLDLQPDWGISQVYPPGLGDLGIELDPGKELPLIPLKASLPEGFEEGRDVLKAMASIGPANFRLLELPALDQKIERSPEQTRSATRGGLSPLEALMNRIAAEASPGTRTVTAITDPSSEWVTAAVELRVRRGP